MLYPIFLDVRKRKCVVVGGGEIAARKVEALRNSGADVTVISPDLHVELQQWADAGDISYVAGEYNVDVLSGAFVVVAATDDMTVNRRVHADCQERNIIINVVDVPELCDFHVPAIIRSRDITIAIGTGGKSPAMARRLRELLQHQIGEEYGLLLDIMGSWRDTVKKCVPGLDRRKDLWERIIASDALDEIKSGQQEKAEQTVKEIVEQEMDQA